MNDDGSSEHPEVVELLDNVLHEVQTTRSYNYLGLDPQLPNTLLQKTNMGDGMIIGVLDTGNINC